MRFCSYPFDALCCHPAFQADDEGSIPCTRSSSLFAVIEEKRVFSPHLFQCVATATGSSCLGRLESETTAAYRSSWWRVSLPSCEQLRIAKPITLPPCKAPPCRTHRCAKYDLRVLAERCGPRTRPRTGGHRPSSRSASPSSVDRLPANDRRQPGCS